MVKQPIPTTSGTHGVRTLAIGAAAAAAAAAVALMLAAPAQAITFGELDGDAHPYAGALVMEWNPDHPGPEPLCSGTLISSTVFMTAGHCTAFLEQVGIAPDEAVVTFDPTFDSQSTLLPGTYHTDPQFGFSGPGGKSDPHDVAVIVLDEPIESITPAILPTPDLLGTLELRDQTFTTVGYGTVRTSKTNGPGAIIKNNFDRRFATQAFNSLTDAWLNLSGNPSTGDGGTCHGDSGGPHLLGDSDVVVSITSTGDTFCRATDTTYRVDTPSARDFLGDFVTLP